MMTDRAQRLTSAFLVSLIASFLVVFIISITVFTVIRHHHEKHDPSWVGLVMDECHVADNQIEYIRTEGSGGYAYSIAHYSINHDSRYVGADVWVTPHGEGYKAVCIPPQGG